MKVFRGAILGAVLGVGLGVLGFFIDMSKMPARAAATGGVGDPVALFLFYLCLPGILGALVGTLVSLIIRK